MSEQTCRIIQRILPCRQLNYSAVVVHTKARFAKNDGIYLNLHFFIATDKKYQYIFVEVRGVASHKGVNIVPNSDTCQSLIGYVSGSKCRNAILPKVPVGRIQIGCHCQVKRCISDNLQAPVRFMGQRFFQKAWSEESVPKDCLCCPHSGIGIELVVEPLYQIYNDMKWIHG